MKYLVYNKGTYLDFLDPKKGCNLHSEEFKDFNDDL